MAITMSMASAPRLCSPARLRVAGADVLPFLPHRLRDGYDFGPAGLEAARAAGASLVITCDCGITAV